MKRILVLLALLIPSLLSAAETLSDNTKFDILLTKPGRTDYYFYEYGTEENALQQVLFNLPSDTEATGKARFGWSIYNNGTYSLSLIFRSKTDGSENDVMLRPTDTTSSVVGYNYSVSIDDSSMKQRPSGLVISSGNETKEIPESSRTLSVLDNISVNSSVGNVGWIDMTFTLSAPSQFMEGQYSGEIVVSVISS